MNAIWVGLSCALGQATAMPETPSVFVLDRIPTSAERERYARGETRGLRPLPLETEGRFRCLVDASILAFEDLRLARMAVGSLSQQDLSRPVTVSMLPPPVQKKILHRLNGMLPSSGGPASVTLSSQLQIIQKTTIPIEGKGRPLALVRRITPNHLSKGGRGVEGAAREMSAGETRTRSTWLLWSPRALNERDYWQLLSSVNSALMKARTDAEIEYQREFDTACRAWFGKSLKETEALIPTSPDGLSGDWQKRWQEITESLSPQERADLPNRPFGKARTDVFFSMKVGTMTLNVSLRAMFEGSD